MNDLAPAYLQSLVEKRDVQMVTRYMQLLAHYLYKNLERIITRNLFTTRDHYSGIIYLTASGHHIRRCNTKSTYNH